MFCRGCGKEIADNAVQCPSCGFHFTTIIDKKMRTSFKAKLVIVVVSVFSAALIFSAISVATEKFLEDAMVMIEHKKNHRKNFRHNDREFEDRHGWNNR